MNGLGYVPVCSSSSQIKTCFFAFYGDTAPILGETDLIFHRRPT